MIGSEGGWERKLLEMGKWKSIDIRMKKGEDGERKMKKENVMENEGPGKEGKETIRQREREKHQRQEARQRERDGKRETKRQSGLGPERTIKPAISAARAALQICLIVQKAGG